MSQTMRVVDAGPLHMEFLYPRAAPRDSETARREKRKITGDAQARMNWTYSTQRLACLMSANFLPDDHTIVFTFDDAHHPPDRAGVLRLFANFCRGLQRSRAARGEKLLALASEEHRHGDGRWHIHALINNVGDLDEIVRRWKYGLALETPFRQGKTRNALTLAYYYTKERKDKVGQRRWLRRGALAAPHTESWQVPDSVSLRLAPGAIQLDRYSRETAYGKSQFLFYIESGGKPRRRRRTSTRGKKGPKNPAA